MEKLGKASIRGFNIKSVGSNSTPGVTNESVMNASNKLGASIKIVLVKWQGSTLSVSIGPDYGSTNQSEVVRDAPPTRGCCTTYSARMQRLSAITR